MKKLLVALTAAAAASVASADRIGIYAGTDSGVFYEQQNGVNSIRYGLNALGLFSGSVGISGEVAYLFPLDAAAAVSNAPLALSPYFGAGVGVGAGIGAVTGLSVYPHALVGARLNVIPAFDVFGEANAGLRVALSNVDGGVAPGFGLRLGASFQFN